MTRSHRRSLFAAPAAAVAAGLLAAACTTSAATPAPSAEASMMDDTPAPSAEASVGSGSFHSVDGSATGTAALYHRADGTFVVTFEDFSIADPSGIHVALVPATDVMSSAEVDRAGLVDLGQVTGTAGMQDYAVPASADVMALHAVVLWDPAMAHAIAAAPLRP